MVSIFDGFDLEYVNSKGFKEDSVREILLVPILSALGYKSHGDYSIERSHSLVHPYVLIGTRKNKINIFPDYLLKVKNNRVCVVDAKSPDENIRNGKNVEQAYSYAIHPEVRTNIYALCNGIELTVFHVGRIDAILIIPLCEIENRWDEVFSVLGPMKIQSYIPIPQNMYPDYGTLIHKLGVGHHVKQFDIDVPISHIARVNESTYSINRVFSGICG